MFKKRIAPKNRAAKISALLTLLGGAFMFIMANGGNIPLPWLAQLIGIALLTFSIYVASAYLFRQYSVVIEPMSGATEDGEGTYDFLVYEIDGRKHQRGDRKVCHVSVRHIEFIRVVTAENKKEVARERAKLDKYTYDSQFAPSRRIEVVIKNGREEASMLLTYDEELLRALVAVGVRKI